MVKVIVDYCGLLYVVACSRVIKTDLEMAVLRYANKISSDAHKKARHIIIIIYFFVIYLFIYCVNHAATYIRREEIKLILKRRAVLSLQMRRRRMLVLSA